jgi:sigma-B regulation protein RsbU (phosphoserine phosphatase)
MQIPVSHGIVGRAISDNCLQMVRDVLLDRTFTGAIDAQTGFVTRSVLCSPMQINGAALGAIEVINKKSADGLFSIADGNLLKALASMVALAIHNARMTEALVGQERVKKELELAGEIQRSLLPRPRAADFPVHGLNLAALEMSGDFYHFFELADGRINFCLGDVSGKGMNASLLMAKTISLFNCLAKTVLRPGLLLAAINEELVETAINGMFVTMVAGIYDPLLQQALFANAGHQPPLHRDREGRFIEFEAIEPPLGIMAGVSYSEQTLQLDGGSLYIFSDGLTEARRQDGSEVGNAGVRALIQQHAAMEPPDRLQGLVACFHKPGAALRDDLTILLVGA